MLPASQLAPFVPAWLLLAGGAALGWLRNFWMRLYNTTLGQLVRRITVSVQVEELDHAEAYLWLQAWVEKRLRDRKLSALQLRRRTIRSDHPEAISADEDESNHNHHYELVPAYGVYPFRWLGRYLVVFGSRREEQGAAPGGSSMFLPRRSVALTIWGTRDRALLLRLVDEARQEWENAHPSSLKYFYHRSSWWRSKPLPERRRETVYLPEGVLEDVLADARRFLGLRSSFERLGVPWRRGFLLYGPPGTGKTTLVQCLATELSIPLYYLSLASIKSRDDLTDLLDSVATSSILLIEDIDCVGAAAERISQCTAGKENAAQEATPPPPVATTAQAPAAEKITASDLLNFIDGIIASQGRILVMTTNHPEKLDAALVRAGRVDRKWEITYASEAQLRGFHASATESGLTSLPWADFSARLPRANRTIADAQALLFGGIESR
ncbi:MAG TPA: AAA family ATPase [Gammaproteobacteria bacterium]|nr:AAA family ATPase [Gammaproteobacteria bacterium]